MLLISEDISLIALYVSEN